MVFDIYDIIAYIQYHYYRTVCLIFFFFLFFFLRRVSMFSWKRERYQSKVYVTDVTFNLNTNSLYWITSSRSIDKNDFIFDFYITSELTILASMSVRESKCWKGLRVPVTPVHVWGFCSISGAATRLSRGYLSQIKMNHSAAAPVSVLDRP